MRRVSPVMTTMVPAWLEPLLSTEFFKACTHHSEAPRCECNMFCVECSSSGSAFCFYCRSQRHSGHRVVQIRRSSYHDVVRVSEVEALLDIGGVQTYVINSARVLFLNERPQQRGAGAAAGKAAASPYNCEICARSLLDPFRFCSLGCKLVGIKRNADATFVINGDGGGGEASGAADNKDAAGCDSNAVAATAAKTATVRPPARQRAQNARRRKGIPHRAPFGS